MIHLCSIKEGGLNVVLDAENATDFLRECLPLCPDPYFWLLDYRGSQGDAGQLHGLPGLTLDSNVILLRNADGEAKAVLDEIYDIRVRDALVLPCVLPASQIGHQYY